MDNHISQFQINKPSNCIDVVAGIILNVDKTHILMSQRTDKEFIHQWEFPGGKLELNEKPEQALQRELKEELSINVQDYSLYFKKTHNYPTKQVNLTFYWVTSFTGIPKGVENQPIEWQDVNHIHQLNFLAANKEVVENVQSVLLANLRS